MVLANGRWRAGTRLFCFTHALAPGPALHPFCFSSPLSLPPHPSGWYGIAPEQCASRGCCSSPPPTYQGDTRLWLPSCFHPNARGAGYRARLSGRRGPGSPGAGNAVGGGRVVPDSAGHLVAALELEGGGTSPELGPDVAALDFEATLLAPDVARVAVSAPGRWALPASTLPGPPAAARHAKDRRDDRDALLTLSATSAPFTVAVARSKYGCAGGKVDGGGLGPASLAAPCAATPLFTTSGSRFIFKDQYIEFSSPIAPGAVLYGAGERTPAAGLPLPRDGLAITLWARDSAAADAGANTYGAWPIVWEVRPDGATHALILLSSNGLEISATEEKLTWRVTGGGLDLIVAAGPTPSDVARQVASIIGFPALQPYWALGLMNSKYGLGSAAVSRRIVESYEAAGIPLETFVSDSQYMDEDRIFTWGRGFERPAMRDFVAFLHETGRKWVPILDPCIAAHKGYRPYEDAVAAGSILIRDVTGAPYLGQMWPGAVHWPDFMDNPATSGWWSAALKRMAADVGGVDGVWLVRRERERERISGGWEMVREHVRARATGGGVERRLKSMCARARPATGGGGAATFPLSLTLLLLLLLFTGHERGLQLLFGRRLLPPWRHLPNRHRESGRPQQQLPVQAGLHLGRARWGQKEQPAAARHFRPALQAEQRGRPA